MTDASAPTAPPRSGPPRDLSDGEMTMTIDDVFEQIRNDIKPRSGVKRIDDALTLLVRYGQTDGEHHKQWCIDQVVRILSGKRYAALVTASKAGESGPDTYGWDEGIAP